MTAEMEKKLEEIREHEREWNPEESMQDADRCDLLAMVDSLRAENDELIKQLFDSNPLLENARLNNRKITHDYEALESERDSLRAQVEGLRVALELVKEDVGRAAQNNVVWPSTMRLIEAALTPTKTEET